MKGYVKYIGVLDYNDKLHHVEFSSGVNVITGKSSTGKSAIIEIFDYCLGSSEFTIPSGIITQHGKLYFIVLHLNGSYIVVARKPNSSRGFIKQESDPNIDKFTEDYFSNEFYVSDFNKELGRYFGLDITDTDEDVNDRAFRFNERKKGRPSIRNMMPFMLQHQNLIANKHSVFYRFDEKEKREQTIEQFKIFCGFVTQEYFTTKQKLADEERNLKSLEQEKKYLLSKSDKNINVLSNLLWQFQAIAGTKLIDDNADKIIKNPKLYLPHIESSFIKINDDLDQTSQEIKKLFLDKNTLLAQKRELAMSLSKVNFSISYANAYKDHLNSFEELDRVKIHHSECPFCKSENEILDKEASKLISAIDWLNSELAKTPYFIDSFEVEAKELESKIKDVVVEDENVNTKIKAIQTINDNLKANRALVEQGLKIKLQVENFLESLTETDGSEIDEKIELSQEDIKKIKAILLDKFNAEGKLKQAESYINQLMKEIGKNFEFEDSYRPINLKFSVDTFEIYHQKDDGEKIYLSSMGSGANWLYSHLTLFMGLHGYLCSLGNQALIPPILFLDQPSQVYFPVAIRDDSETFDATDLKQKKEGKTVSPDEDLKAVTNMFDQLIKFCANTLKVTGTEPQIIITDHADNLELTNGDFDELVNGRRWRSRGFISF